MNEWAAGGVTQWYNSLPGILNARHWIANITKEKSVLLHSEIYQ